MFHLIPPMRRRSRRGGGHSGGHSGGRSGGDSGGVSGGGAFTLVELLVVIAIISMLVAILLPALASARKAAQNIKCMAQVRQFAGAMHMYIADERNTAMYRPSPAAVAGRAIPGAHPTQPIMAGSIGWFYNFSLWPYLSSYSVYVCPSSRRTVDNLVWGTGGAKAWTANNWHGFVYGYNPRLAGVEGGAASSGMQFKRVSSWKSPSQTAAFAEVRNWNSATLGDPAGDFRVSAYQTYSYGVDTAVDLTLEQLSHRHPGDANNVGYADGHAVSRKLDDIAYKDSNGTISWYWQSRFWDPTR